MATQGSMSKLATFKRDTGAVGPGGSKIRNWTDVPGLVRVPIEYKPQRGRERVAAGRLEAAALAFITIQDCNAVRDLTPADVVVVHEQSGDVPHRIYSLENPDQRSRDVEIVAEKGVQLG
jgi:head-tail adaptor